MYNSSFLFYLLASLCFCQIKVPANLFPNYELCLIYNNNIAEANPINWEGQCCLHTIVIQQPEGHDVKVDTKTEFV